MNQAIAKLPTYIQEKVSTATVPIQYNAAVKALGECRNIDEAKLYADKSDALAAWAKIYNNDRVGTEAKRLKLHAFRRMGALAIKLQPGNPGVMPHGGQGSPPGPISLLKELGLKRGEAQSATVLSRMPKRKFNAAVNSNTPRAPSYYRYKNIGASDAWKTIHVERDSLSSMLRYCRANDPKKLAKGLTKSEVTKAQEIATEIIEWMDTFDQYLPRGKK